MVAAGARAGAALLASRGSRAGGGSGKIKGGRHLQYPANTPMHNLYGTLLDVAGVPVETLTSSTGKLEPISID